MRDLAARFSALGPTDKGIFLASVAHEATIAARAAYTEDYQRPDGIVLRETNEFVHRVSGYAMHVLDGSEEQDASVMKMIELYFEERRLSHRLRRLLSST